MPKSDLKDVIELIKQLHKTDVFKKKKKNKRNKHKKHNKHSNQYVSSNIPQSYGPKGSEPGRLASWAGVPQPMSNSTNLNNLIGAEQLRGLENKNADDEKQRRRALEIANNNEQQNLKNLAYEKRLDEHNYLLGNMWYKGDERFKTLSNSISELYNYGNKNAGYNRGDNNDVPTTYGSDNFLQEGNKQSIIDMNLNPVRPASQYGPFGTQPQPVFNTNLDDNINDIDYVNTVSPRTMFTNPMDTHGLTDRSSNISPDVDFGNIYKGPTPGQKKTPLSILKPSNDDIFIDSDDDDDDEISTPIINQKKTAESETSATKQRPLSSLFNLRSMYKQTKNLMKPIDNINMDNLKLEPTISQPQKNKRSNYHQDIINLMNQENISYRQAQQEYRLNKQEEDEPIIKKRGRPKKNN
jgi:hypothetical protein